jgi:hypothetical protein
MSLFFSRKSAFGGISPTILLAAAAVTAFSIASCSFSSVAQFQPKDICNCVAVLPDVSDYRHVAKHVPIPAVTPIETDVTTILSWAQDFPLPPDAPRSGRELQVFHVAQAYLQNASMNSGDCDIHLEISAIPDKTAPRVIVETPVDANFCPARQNIQAQLQQHGFKLDAVNGGEIPTAIPADVVGLAFEDFEHDRGSAQVSTVWELHPAQVTLH